MSLSLSSVLGGKVIIKPENTSSDFTQLMPVASGDVVLETATQTLSNKTISDPVMDMINSGPMAGFRNVIINGNFDYWQRGTTVTNISTQTYLSDRWKIVRSGATVDVLRQSFTLGQTDVPYEPTYFHRMVVNSVTGAANYALLEQPIESVRTFANTVCTLSFWAKADTYKNMAIEIQQSFGTGGSASVFFYVGSCNIDMNWKKYVFTFTMPSITGKTVGTSSDDSCMLHFWLDAGTDLNSRTGNLDHQSGVFDIAQVQLEAGPTATTFERRPPQTEFALCQRYYQNSSSIVSGYAYAAVVYHANIYNSHIFPVSMRRAPTMSIIPTGGTVSDVQPNQFGWYSICNSTVGAYYIAQAEL